jgi:hypothetical protein
MLDLGKTSVPAEAPESLLIRLAPQVGRSAHPPGNAAGIVDEGEQGCAEGVAVIGG